MLQTIKDLAGTPLNPSVHARPDALVPTPWVALEQLAGASALPVVWHVYLGTDFLYFASTFLEQEARPVIPYPCPRACGCWHKVQPDGSGAYVGRCTCPSRSCPDLILTRAQVTPLILNSQKLGRAICRALECQISILQLQPPNTIQIGSLPKSAIPLILTIQPDRASFRAALSELVIRHQQPGSQLSFILIAPTARFLDASCTDLLNHARAAFLPLDTTLVLNDEGKFFPVKPPAELFAPFLSTLSPSHAGHFQPAPTPARPDSPEPRYHLAKGLGLWQITFNSGTAPLKSDIAMAYVASLLLDPPRHHIHAIDLTTRIPNLYRKQLGLTEIIHPDTGQSQILDQRSRLQERSLASENQTRLRLARQKQKSLQHDLEAEANPAIQEEMLAELEEITEYLAKNARRTADGAQKIARNVRQEIKRLVDRLARTIDEHGNPHPVLRPFGQHINDYILIPSSRFISVRAPSARAGIAGCLIYEPPPGVIWNNP